jgi:aminopeptidase
MRDPRLAKLADVLVNYSTSVSKGQLVRISGPPVSTPLVLEIHRKVIEAGGNPMIRMGPEEAQEIFLKHAAKEQLSFVNPVTLFEYDKMDVSIGLWAEENTRALTNADPEQMRIAESARKPLMEVFLRRAAEKQLKWVGTQFPTQACAQDAEMSLAEYEDFVFRAGMLDQADPVAAWKKISERQNQRATAAADGFSQR